MTAAQPKVLSPLQVGKLAMKSFYVRPFQLAMSKAFLTTISKPDSGLLLCAPIRHGKSVCMSQVFPAWALASFPDWRICIASSTVARAESFSRATKRTFNEVAGPLFGLSVDPELDRLDQWGVVGHQGFVYAAGMGSAIQGIGFDLIIADDVLKGREVVISDVQRESAWQWFWADLLSRREPGCRTIVVQSRWHDDDLAGRIIKLKEEGEEFEDWDYLRLPVFSEGPDVDALQRPLGEPLDPVRWPLEKLLKKKRAYEVAGVPWFWDANFDQAPSGDGTLAEWPREYLADIWFDELPVVRPFMRVLALDPSKTRTSKSGDLASFADVLLDRSGHLWERTTASVMPVTQIEERAVQIVRAAKQNADGFGGQPFNGMLIESNDLQYVIACGIAKRFEREGLNVPVFGVESHDPKTVRIRMDLTALLAQKRLHLQKACPGNRVLHAQMQVFPNGAHDDCPDSLSMATRLINFFLSGDRSLGVTPLRLAA